MHPAYHSDRPGKAPDCGMDLEPGYAADGRSESAAMGPGKIHLAPDQEQAVHLQTETVRMRSTARSVHTVGRVAPDEALTYRVSAGVDGWVRRVFSDRTGTRVKAGEALAAFFSKDISAPQQAYVYALESYERLKHAPASPGDQLVMATQQLATARDNLEFVGMGKPQIEQLSQTRHEIYEINLTAPANGQVLGAPCGRGPAFRKRRTALSHRQS
jgi:membrane fusion protein, copper/silver efflux system